MKTSLRTKALHKKLINGFSILALGLSLSACSNTIDRLERIGQAPDFKPVEVEETQRELDYVRMPMPKANILEQTQQANSLWQPHRKGFFKDQRAGEVGDILTVVIDINDIAEITNETIRERTSTETANVASLLGFETYLDDILPEGVDPNNLANLGSTTSTDGNGEVTRDEVINTRMAAVIANVLPNGNLVITGHQEVRVNFEVRELRVAGVIRPEDISPNNTIDYEQIAEARIAYGGRGQITDVQQPRYGQQFFDIVYPF